MALADFKRSLGVIDRDKSPLGSFFGGGCGDTEMGLKPTNESLQRTPVSWPASRTAASSGVWGGSSPYDAL